MSSKISIILIPGHFYLSKIDQLWCCYYKNTNRPAHWQAECVRVSDGRIEYFYEDGRNDFKGETNNTLISETTFKCEG